MNAIQFFQEHGIEKARKVVEGAPTGKSFISGKEITADFYDIKAEKYGMADGVYKFLWDKDWCVHSYSFPEFVLNTFSIPDLKCLVDSVDLVNSNGGWNGTKNTITLFQSSLDLGLYHGVDGVDAEVEIPRLKQAIADYESIYSIPESVRQAILNLEMHL